MPIVNSVPVIACNVISYWKKIFKKEKKKNKNEDEESWLLWKKATVSFNNELGDQAGGNHCMVTVLVPVFFLDYVGVGQQF